jgi:hypothetical protein
VLGLAASPLIPFWPLLTRQMTIAEGDFSEEYFPVLLTAVRAIRGGELPLWNPYSNGGQPLVGDPQAALFYPPTWLAMSRIGGLDGGSILALEALIPLHLALAAASAFVLGRVVLGSRLAATMVAVAYTYSGFLTSYPIEQLPILRAAAWFPLLVAFIWLALERGSWFWSLAAGVAFGLAILAGHPQTAFLEVIGVSVVAVGWAYLRRQERREWRAGPRVALTLGLMLGVGFGLSAVQVLPTLEFARVSNRSQVDYTFLAGGFTLWELPMDMLVPRILGGRPPYVGIFTLVLTGVALLVGTSRIRGIAVALAMTGLILSTGAHTFLYAALYNFVPGFDIFRGQERSIMLYALGLALLAGAGIAALQDGRAHSLKPLAGLTRLTGVSAILVAGLSAALYWRSLGATVGAERWSEIVRWSSFCAALLLCGYVILAVRQRVPAVRRVLPYVALAMVTVDLLAVGWHAHLRDRRPDEVYLPSVLIDRAMRDLGPARVYDEWVLKGNHGQAYGLPTVTRTFPIHLERFELATVQLSQDRLSDLLNVRYMSTWQAPNLSRQPLVQETDANGAHYLYARAALGPAWIVPSAEVVPAGWEALHRVADPDFDPRTRVVLEATETNAPSSGGFGTVLAYERRFNSVEITADAPRGGYLVVSEMAYPAWRVWVDGAEAPLLHANYLVQGIWLTPGTHRVTLAVQPTSLLVGLAISVATIFGLLCFLFGVLAGSRLARPPRVGDGAIHGGASPAFTRPTNGLEAR